MNHSEYRRKSRAIRAILQGHRRFDEFGKITLPSNREGISADMRQYLIRDGINQCTVARVIQRTKLLAFNKNVPFNIQREGWLTIKPSTNLPDIRDYDGSFHAHAIAYRELNRINVRELPKTIVFDFGEEYDIRYEAINIFYRGLNGGLRQQISNLNTAERFISITFQQPRNTPTDRFYIYRDEYS